MEQTMKQIASFTVNHDKLEKGMYISRIDGDVVTYDIRMKKPNGGDYLSNGALHTFEHLFATYARNSRFSASSTSGSSRKTGKNLKTMPTPITSEKGIIRPSR